ncbi:MAG: zinc-dependent alcohol dehydrogenase family protein [Xanthomonadales bacterium]|nr:zinc-dependent alcohol dehydrogenase family protein [Xanthomonadales bacterium]
MKAVLYNAFSAQPTIENVPDPAPQAGGVVLRVMASGVCLSDWHGWKGHDPDITLPHVPGHELAGTVEAVGTGTTNWRVGDRVTVPFVGGCGHCPQCESGNQQVCDHQFQPGFTHWGSFAEYVSIQYADTNLVRLPDDMAFDTAASLGCRFATAFRAIVDQGRAAAGEWIAVHGCGGVGLSAIMIAHALEARVLAVDISDEKLERASSLGADACLNISDKFDIPEAVKDLTRGGPHVSVDAIGNSDVVGNSILSLRKRGRHVQVGLMGGETRPVEIAMDAVIANELEIRGSHGMQAHRYGEMIGMITSGALSPEALIGRRISLEESIEVLTSMDQFQNEGLTVITEFWQGARARAHSDLH